MNYAVYRIGNWKNNYKINLTGNGNEIPATNSTRDHVINSMNEIRKAVFEIECGKEVNGLLALSYQISPELQKENIDELIKIEENEYNAIIEELNNLDNTLENDEDSIDIETNKFLIYKLEKDHHVTVSKPANDFTMNHHLEEIKKLNQS
ncbi:MAG: hypothetical protein ACRC1M_01765 [Methanobacteriaceae archaeon]